MVRLPSVWSPRRVSRRETFSERYWSSLFPPRLMMSAIREDGSSWPDTPAPLQAAWVACIGGPQEHVAALRSGGERVGHDVQLQGLVLERVQHGGGECRQLVDPVRRVGGVGLADVLVVEQELVDVACADDLARGRRDGSRHLEELLETLDVDGDDPVDGLACAGLPHAGGQGAVHVELRRQSQVSPIDAGEQPSPTGGEVPGHVHVAGGDSEGGRRDHAGQMELAVARGDDPGLEERARTRAHLGVVARQEQVGRGPLQNGGG